MAYQQKEGDIAVWLQTRRSTDKHPHWVGTAVVNGVEMNVALWIHSDTMLTGKIKPPRIP